MNTKSVALWVVRVAAALSLVIGLVIWPGNADSLIPAHIGIGVVLTIALLVVAYQGFRAHVTGLAVVAVVWAIALPVLGLVQGAAPDSLALPVQVFHLLFGLGAWVLAEFLGRRLAR